MLLLCGRIREVVTRAKQIMNIPFSEFLYYLQVFPEHIAVPSKPYYSANNSFGKVLVFRLHFISLQMLAA